MRDIEKIISEVNATMAIEGMPITEEDKEKIRIVYRGEISATDMIKSLIEKHTVKSGI